MRTGAIHGNEEVTVQIPTGDLILEGTLGVPTGPQGLVIFAHGSGSSRHSPRNRYVAQELRNGGLATLLLDLLTSDEEAADRATGHLRFDIGLLAERLMVAADWAIAEPDIRVLPVGFFGASTGAGAALVAAAERPGVIRAVVSRGGRPDLAGEALRRVQAPVLLIVGGNDQPVIELNRQAMRSLRAHHELQIVPGATHLFEEPGTLEQVAGLARDWFQRYLPAAQQPADRAQPGQWAGGA